MENIQNHMGGPRVDPNTLEGWEGLERLRITVTPKHRKEHIENMVRCLDKVWSDLSLPRKNSTKLQANN